MIADDELRQAFATLTDHLHQEVGRQIAQITAELAAAAREHRERAVADAAAEAERHADARLAAAAKDAEERRAAAETQAREEGRQIGIEEGRFEGYEQSKAEALEQAEAAAASRSRETAAADRLADAIRTLDRARSLSEILDTLASCAGREAVRVGVLLAAADRFRGWRFIGFGPAFETANEVDLSAEQAGIIADAARTGAPALWSDGMPLPGFVDAESSDRGFAIPIVLAGETVAVLYAEIEQGKREKEEGERHDDEGKRDALEILARHAARCLEAVTAFKTIRLLTERPDLTPAFEPGSAGHRDANADENAAALRYAKLLVSEIRMYHEAEVVAGRRERNLAARLGGEIARARVLYEERVPAHVRRRSDHFRDELVRTLADGDAALVEA
jgi:hypothetical protein